VEDALEACRGEVLAQALGLFFVRDDDGDGPPEVLAERGDEDAGERPGRADDDRRKSRGQALRACTLRSSFAAPEPLQ
jgi:hypothetical protein